MKRTIRQLALLLLVAALGTVAACGARESVILNGFDELRELYSIRPAIQLMDGSVDIVTPGSGPVHSGSGSALLTYLRGSSPYLVLHLAQTAHPDVDLTAMAQTSLWIYHDEPQAVSGQLTLVGTDFSPLLTQAFTLEPGQWNQVILLLPPESYDPAQVLGFGLLLEPTAPARFYLDTWTLS